MKTFLLFWQLPATDKLKYFEIEPEILKLKVFDAMIDGSVDQRDKAEYYLSIWPLLKEKWKRAGALETAFEKDRPLGCWRQIVQHLYGIELNI